MSSNSSLTATEKKWIIQQHVTHKSYSEIAAEFELEFNKDIKKSTVAYYNPDSSTGGQPAEHLCELYYRLKKETEEVLKRVDIADPIYRLRKLQNIIERRDHRSDGDAEDDRVILRAIKEARAEMDQFDFGSDDEDGEDKKVSGRVQQWLEGPDEDEGTDEETASELDAGHSGRLEDGGA